MVILTLMITLTRYNPTRLHFLLKLLGGMLLYWAFVWGLHFLVYGGNCSGAITPGKPCAE